jgi:hypothetical protein
MLASLQCLSAYRVFVIAEPAATNLLSQVIALHHRQHLPTATQRKQQKQHTHTLNTVQAFSTFGHKHARTHARAHTSQPFAKSSSMT